MPDNLDAIIIGSGIGGLTHGVIMAKAGKKVNLLCKSTKDQNGIPARGHIEILHIYCL